MDSESLRLLLDRLQAEIARDQPIDDERRAQLVGLHDDVERLLSGPPPHEAPAHLPGRLQSAAVSFESTHPQLASLLEQTCNVLSNFGL